MLAHFFNDPSSLALVHGTVASVSVSRKEKKGKARVKTLCTRPWSLTDGCLPGCHVESSIHRKYPPNIIRILRLSLTLLLSFPRTHNRTCSH